MSCSTAATASSPSCASTDARRQQGCPWSRRCRRRTSRTYAAYNAAMSAPNPREAVRVVQESFADPEIEWVSEASVPEPQTYHGIDGVMEFFDGILDAFEYARQVPERFIDCGDQVLAFVRTEARGRTTGIEFKRTVGTPDHGARRQSGRAGRDRAQALRAVLAPADGEAGLRVRAPIASPATSCARLELAAGDPSRRGRRSGSAASKREQRHERELSERFELAYRRLTDDWQPRGSGAGATRGRAS